MICHRCGTYMTDDALTCENCGSLLSGGASRPRETGVRAMRQGRLDSTPPVLPDDPRENVPEYGDYDMSPVPLDVERSPRRKTAPKGLASFASRPTTQRGVPVNTRRQARPIAHRHVKTYAVKRHNINWMLIGLIIAGVLVLAVAGYMVYMSTTMEGQRMTARRVIASTTEPLLELATSKDDLRQTEREEALKELNSAPAQAYWLVGQEYMDLGDVVTGILSFRIADILDPENYDGLLLLANAYELENNDDAAETLYLRLSAEIAPSRTEAYTALIRMYQDQSRDPEAADMMLLAYQNTDKETYRLQRKDFIPNTPQVDLPAGRYKLEQTINLTSPQGYDIYYTLDDEAQLPDGGKYIEDGVMTIPEGTLTLRAVCVSDDLVSDPLVVTYTVYYPTPPAPRTNLAPNTYNKLHTVSLRPGSSEDYDEKDDILTYYYTIDGSTPTEDSPIYDGTPIQLPSGRVMLRAVVVNKYGKMSSTCEVGYKFNAKPYPLEVYGEEDTFNGFSLMSTTIEEFKSRFGEPKNTFETQYLSLPNEAEHFDYDWGYAVFILNGTSWVLARIDMNSEIASGPRGVGFGSSENEITSVYKDYGQLQSPNGDRGLYYEDPSIGRVIQNADGTRTIQYSSNTLESKVWVLQYHLQNNRVVRMVHYYQP